MTPSNAGKYFGLQKFRLLMKKFILINLLFLLILNGCKENKKVELSDKPSKSNNLLEAQIKDFDNYLNISYSDSTLLLLNFHGDMSPRHGFFNGNQQLKLGTLLFHGDSLAPRKELFNEDKFVRIKHFSNQLGFKESEELLPMFMLDGLYMPISFGGNNYVMRFWIHFQDNKLSNIQLKGPVKYSSSEIHENEWKQIKSELIKLYSTKYGMPKVTKRKLGVFELAVLKAKQKDKKFDDKIFIFKDKEKRIELYQSTGDYEMTIKYMLNSRFEESENRIKREEDIKRKTNKSNAKKTLENI